MFYASAKIHDGQQSSTNKRTRHGDNPYFIKDQNNHYHHMKRIGICLPSENLDQPGLHPSLVSLRCWYGFGPYLSSELTVSTSVKLGRRHYLPESLLY